jgi:hypothetical protein
MEKDYNEFVDEHPEATTDEDKAKKIGKFLKRFHRDYADDNDGELPTMKHALETAYRYYGWPLSDDKSQEEVAHAAKKRASTRQTPQGSKPKKKKDKATDLETFFAKKLGVKL